MTWRRHAISYRGKGKWQTFAALDKYRRKRIRRNAEAKASRARNRAQ